MKFSSYRGYAWKRKTPRPVKALAALLAAGCLIFALLSAAVALGARDEVEGEPSVMIILGCQVMDWGPSLLLRDRLDTALAYLDAHPGMTVVVSGGQGPNEPMSEADVMAAYLEAAGFPPAGILREDASSNTWENFCFSLELLRAQEVDLTDGVLVVSNGFHLTRARLLAGRAGFEDVSVLAAPSSHLPSRLQMYIREPLALAKSLMLDR